MAPERPRRGMPSTRRRFLATAAMATGIAGCAGGPVTSATPTETGTSTETTPTTTPPVGSPPVRWTREFPHDAVTAPTLAPGPDAPALYVGSDVADGGLTPTAGRDQVLYALSVTDGETVWTAPLPNPLQRPPVVAGDRVYAVSGVESTHGTAFAVHALDRATGERVWTFDTDARRFVYPLDATEETVFVGRRDDQLGTTGEVVYALAAADGRERWHVETGDAMGGEERFGTLFVDSGRLLSALVTEDGTERWRVATEDYVTGPAYDERAAYYAADGTIHSRAFDGTTRWRREADFTVTRVDRPAGGAADHVHVGDYDGRMLALSPHDGTVDWTLSVDRDQFRPSVARFSSRLYVAERDIRELDPVSGDVQWALRPAGEGSLDVHPGPGTVFVAAPRTGAVFSVLPGDGQQRWRYAPAAYRGLATAGNTAFVTAGARLEALDGQPRQD